MNARVYIEELMDINMLYVLFIDSLPEVTTDFAALMSAMMVAIICIYHELPVLCHLHAAKSHFWRQDLSYVVTETKLSCLSLDAVLNRLDFTFL